MSLPLPASDAPCRHVACFRSGDALRSRSVSGRVLSATLGVPAPPARLLADWERELSEHLAVAPGDVESLPLARARMLWPDYKSCVQAVADWTRSLGLSDVLAASEVALMACRGARYHHDGGQYGGAAFCNLFLSEDRGLDVHFPFTGHRIPLVRGTALVFDTGQPHAVVPRGSSAFDAADFAAAQDRTQVFLTWELPIEDTGVAHALGIAFDVDPASSPSSSEGQVCVNGTPGDVCPSSGRWRPSA